MNSALPRDAASFCNNNGAAQNTVSVNPFGVDVLGTPDCPAEAANFNSLETAVSVARTQLLSERFGAGNWCYEFEADCTIPAEFLLLLHFCDDLKVLDEVGEDIEQKIANYIRSQRHDGGGWSLYPGGQFDVSCSVKAYYALKLAGDDVDAVHMREARATILGAGGAAQSNVFTHVTLALFEQIPWRGVPFIPVEMILFPRWFPFHLSKVSYWSRAVMVPLAVLCSVKARAVNPRGVDIAELFTTAPDEERSWFPIRSTTNRVFLWADAVARRCENCIPTRLRAHALERAYEWIEERIIGADGLGAIFPAMVNAHEALLVAGAGPQDPRLRLTRDALKRLIVVKGDVAYVQPCLSPVWDTALASLACIEAQALDDANERAQIVAGLDWLVARQLSDEPGDWRLKNPQLAGGGWAFQYDNPHYPDVDDTAAVGWAMHLADSTRYAGSIERAAHWVAGMQSRNGGFASFDIDNTHYYLNEIPFADHGALLDPPTADVTGRCVGFLALANRQRYALEIDRAVAFLAKVQDARGCWFGRWGTNYIYGTWSVLVALELAQVPAEDPMIVRAVEWLESTQREDGSWGESNDAYLDPALAGGGAAGTAFQTAWALLALMATQRANDASVHNGVEYLRRAQRNDGLWYDREFTAPGFPRVFYLKYHGYSRYFPLWALARFQREADAFV